MASQMAQILNNYRQTMPSGGLERGIQGGIQNYFAAKSAGEQSKLRQKQMTTEDLKQEEIKQDQIFNKLSGPVAAADTNEKWLAAQNKGFIPKEMDYGQREPFIMGMLQRQGKLDADRLLGATEAETEELKLKREGLDLRRAESEARRLEQQLKGEDNDLRRQELQLKIDERRGKIDKAKRDAEASATSKIRQQGMLTTAIDDFLGNKAYVDAVTGYRGRIPSLTTTGLEAEAYFNNIKNNLTLENLDKMSGVLSETDIKILSNAATALVPGMGRKAMTDEMNKIKGVLNSKTSDIQKQILGIEPVTQGGQSVQQGQQIPEGSTATNPQTQQRLIYTNGQWQPL